MHSLSQSPSFLAILIFGNFKQLGLNLICTKCGKGKLERVFKTPRERFRNFGFPAKRITVTFAVNTYINQFSLIYLSHSFLFWHLSFLF